MEVPYSGERIKLYHRIFNKVEVQPETCCWYFKGLILISGRKEKAHRVMYSLIHGHTPPNREIIRICGHDNCCNPTHLRLGRKFGNQHTKKKRSK